MFSILFLDQLLRYYPPIYAYVFQVASFPQVYAPKPCMCQSTSLCVTCPTHPILLHLITQYWASSTIQVAPQNMQCSPLPSYRVTLRSKTPSPAPYSQTPSAHVRPSVRKTILMLKRIAKNNRMEGAVWIQVASSYGPSGYTKRWEFDHLRHYKRLKQECCMQRMTE
jgi:hypothetical protein